MVAAQKPLPGLEASGLLAEAHHGPGGASWHYLVRRYRRTPGDQQQFAAVVGNKKGREIGGLLQGFDQGWQLASGGIDVAIGGHAGQSIELGLGQGRVEGQGQGCSQFAC